MKIGKLKYEYHSIEDKGFGKAFASAKAIGQLAKKVDTLERREEMFNSYKETMKERYNNKFIQRLLSIIEKYTSAASIKVLKYIEPFQKAAVIKNLILIFSVSDP